MFDVFLTSESIPWLATTYPARHRLAANEGAGGRQRSRDDGYIPAASGRNPASSTGAIATPSMR